MTDPTKLALDQMRFDIALDGATHRVVVADTTARQVAELQAMFGCTVDDLVAALLSQQIGPLDAAALVYLARRQAGEQPDPAELLDGITIGTSCEVTFLGEVVADDSLGASPEA